MSVCQHSLGSCARSRAQPPPPGRLDPRAARRRPRSEPSPYRHHLSSVSGIYRDISPPSGGTTHSRSVFDVRARPSLGLTDDRLYCRSMEPRIQERDGWLFIERGERDGRARVLLLPGVFCTHPSTSRSSMSLSCLLRTCSRSWPIHPDSQADLRQRVSAIRWRSTQSSSRARRCPARSISWSDTPISQTWRSRCHAGHTVAG